MDSIPNEVLRIILSHLSINQRKIIKIVSKIWAYLVLTFCPKRYVCVSHHDVGYRATWYQFLSSINEMIIYCVGPDIVIFDGHNYKKIRPNGNEELDNNRNRNRYNGIEKQ